MSTTIYTAEGAVAYVTVTITADVDLTGSIVQLSIGSYTAPGSWQAPDVVTINGATATAKILVGAGHTNPAAGKHWAWYKVTDSPTVTIEPVRRASFTTTG